MTSSKRLALGISLCLVVAACAPATTADPTPPTSTNPPAPTDDPATDEAAPSPSSPPDATGGEVALVLEEVVAGLDVPVWADSPGDGRIWVAERAGRIVVVTDGVVRDREVVDLRDRVLTGGERGLLAFEFLRDEPSSDDVTRLVVHYSAQPDGRTRVATLEVDADAATADPATEEVLLEVPQPAGNHNGGTVALGPDGNLWVALGDGGGARDQFDQAQRTDTLLGAILRLDVGGPGEGYGIPADNPFADRGGAPEVWAYGARNPWRIAFDGDRLYVADVGQDQREEISVLDATDHAGHNLGWPLREGTRCFSGDCGDGQELVDPVVEYDHGDGCSLIGGLVHRGRAEQLRGHYFYSDLCGGFLRSFTLDDGGAVASEHDWSAQVGSLGTPLSFGRDADGELLILTVDGRIRRITAG